MDDIVLLAPTRWQLRRGEGSQLNAGGAELREAPGQDLIGGSSAALISSAITSRVKG
jgi:hypothetical protein